MGLNPTVSNGDRRDGVVNWRLMTVFRAFLPQGESISSLSSFFSPGAVSFFLNGGSSSPRWHRRCLYQSSPLSHRARGLERRPSLRLGGCIFPPRLLYPECTGIIAAVVRSVASCNAQFAIRGGVYLPAVCCVVQQRFARSKLDLENTSSSIGELRG